MKNSLYARRANLKNMEYQHKYMWNQVSQTHNFVDWFENFYKDIEEKLKGLSKEIENGENVHVNSLLLDLYKEKKEH